MWKRLSFGLWQSIKRQSYTLYIFHNEPWLYWGNSLQIMPTLILYLLTLWPFIVIKFHTGHLLNIVSFSQNSNKEINVKKKIVSFCCTVLHSALSARTYCNIISAVLLPKILLRLCLCVRVCFQQADHKYDAMLNLYHLLIVTYTTPPKP